MLIKASPLSCSWFIVECRWFFTSFSFKKLFSAAATVTGKVTGILNTIQRFVYISCSCFWWRNLRSSMAVFLDGNGGRLRISSAISFPVITACPSLLSQCLHSVSSLFFLTHVTTWNIIKIQKDTKSVLDIFHGLKSLLKEMKCYTHNLLKMSLPGFIVHRSEAHQQPHKRTASWCYVVSSVRELPQCSFPHRDLLQLLVLH